MYCSVCGEKMEADAKFCKKCGARLTASTVPNETANISESACANLGTIPAGLLQKSGSAWQTLKEETPENKNLTEIGKLRRAKSNVGFVIAAICAVVLVLALLAGGSDKLVGSWTRVEREGETTPDFTFYSDGACKLRGDYGMGKWKRVDGKLRITSFYGETYVFNYNVNSDKLTLSQGGQKTTYTKTGAAPGSNSGNTVVILLSMIGLMGGGLYGAIMRWDIFSNEDGDSK